MHCNCKCCFVKYSSGGSSSLTVHGGGGGGGGHRDKWSSEIIAQKWLKGFNNTSTQTKCHGQHCLSIFCYLVCAVS